MDKKDEAILKAMAGMMPKQVNICAMCGQRFEVVPHACAPGTDFDDVMMKKFDAFLNVLARVQFDVNFAKKAVTLGRIDVAVQRFDPVVTEEGTMPPMVAQYVRLLESGVEMLDAMIHARAERAKSVQ